MTKQEFARWAGRELILMDGATGSNLMAAGMPQRESAELWILKNPEIVKNFNQNMQRRAAGSYMRAHLPPTGSV